MAALTQCRAIAGPKAFAGVRARQTVAVSNGSKYFMKRKDTYMVEVRSSGLGAMQDFSAAGEDGWTDVLASHLATPIHGWMRQEAPRFYPTCPLPYPKGEPGRG